MAPARRTLATGHIALCVALAGWAWVAVGFIAPSARSGVSPQSLRGGAELRRFSSVQEEPQASKPLASMAVFAAALGLAVTMVTSPVRAEEGDAETAFSQGSVAGKQARKKKKREGAVTEAKKEEAPAPKAPKAAPAKAEESGGGFSLPFALPNINVPNTFGDAPKAIQTSSDAAPVVPFKKNFINPSDEMDLDEVPLSKNNIPLLITLLFGPSFIFIAFWVLGSLEII